MSDVVDGTAIEEPGTAVAVVEAQPPAGLFRTNDPVQVVQEAVKVADALKAVIVAKNLFTMIQGKAHVGVEGWTLLGSMLGVTAICTKTEQIDDVTWKATVEARDQHGRVVGQADALCSGREKRGPWKNAEDYARISMAQTRATSKALKGPLGFVLSLAGYATTPAEEMTFAEPDLAGGTIGGRDTPASANAGRASSSSARPAKHASDVTPTPTPSTDEWTEQTVQRLKDTGVWDDAVLLKAGLKEVGVVPTPGAQRKTTLFRLNAERRERFRAWIDQQAEVALIEAAKDKLGAMVAESEAKP
jgi:hypothetical protein